MESRESTDDCSPQSGEAAETEDGAASMTPEAIESQVRWAEDLHRRLTERLDATAEK